MSSKLPWEKVKAESIRSICGDLGRRTNSRAEGIEFLRKAEEEGLDAALAVEAATPKRKADRPLKETPAEPERRSKRPRKSVGGVTPVKSRRESRAEERSAKKFDGVELPSSRRSSRRSPVTATTSSAQVGDEEVEDAPDSTNLGLEANAATFEPTSPIPSGSDADKENRRVEPEDEADADGEDEHADAPLESGVAA